VNCPELEALLLDQAEGTHEFGEHVAGCAGCAAVLEEHRQLEKDLFRLADPLPPADLVAKVMQRVAAEPLPLRAEIRVGVSILAATVMAAVLSFVATRGPIGLLGASAARSFVAWKTSLWGLNNAVQVAWSTTTVPLALCLSVLLFVSLVGLRRMTPARTAEIEVLP
jgi:hypothetical protein